jgi:hypothetical protein
LEPHERAGTSSDVRACSSLPLEVGREEDEADEEVVSVGLKRVETKRGCREVGRRDG